MKAVGYFPRLKIVVEAGVEMVGAEFMTIRTLQDLCLFIPFFDYSERFLRKG